MDKNRLYNIIRNTQSINEDDIKELTSLVASFPYFTIAQMLLAAGTEVNGYKNSTRHVRMAAAMVPNREALRRFIAEAKEKKSLSDLPDEFSYNTSSIYLSSVDEIEENNDENTEVITDDKTDRIEDNCTGIEQEKEKMWRLYQDLGSYAKVAKRINRNADTVSKYVREYEPAVRVASVILNTKVES